MGRLMNPLQRYRRAQRVARRLFEPFTSRHCSTCETPCCRKPSWVRPFDIILVEELGYRLPAADAGRPARELLTLLAEGEMPAEAGACDFLDSNGCTFPADLRPFGCVASICEPMRRLLPPDDLAAVEAAVDDLRRAYEALTAAALGAAPDPE